MSGLSHPDAQELLQDAVSNLRFIELILSIISPLSVSNSSAFSLDHLSVHIKS
jgi:hypothetical protein